ncbi:DUF6777 domain-containing protein [Streptomyces sp. NPDC050523]|uniref:DUF6777 domain-containing protein n=1 Tax=Streptomyces sp. NPDC050523 TaxID=3365622 RepID=UPI0037B4594F
MRTASRTLATACLLSAALLVAGCGGGEADTKAGAEVFLQPAANQGPDPFTGSTAVPSPSTGSPRPGESAQTGGSAQSGGSGAVRAISGSMPGLYAGTVHAGSCDVDRQIGQLAADRTRAGAFAQVAGVSPASLPDYLRGLAPVVLRADTLVTNHGYRAGRTTSFQSVLQAGTAVLVDNRGMPRVRCACGNPLQAAGTTHGGRTQGAAWPAYRAAQVIVVTPAPQAVTDITIIDAGHRTWIERHVGHDVQHDHVVPPPAALTPLPTPTPSPDGSASGTGPSESAGSTSPDGRTPSPSDPSGDCASPVPTVTVTPGAAAGTSASPPDETTGKPPSGTGDCPTATVTAVPPTTTVPGHPQSSPAAPSSPDNPASPVDPDETGPVTVPDTPDQPDGSGLVPGDTTTSIIFDSPTGVLDS